MELAIVLGVAVSLAFSWMTELLPSVIAPAKIRLSTDERWALKRTNKINRVFVRGGLNQMGRREILRNVASIWKSARTVTLRSGRFVLTPWLALFCLTCFLLVLKTLVVPSSRDLRVLLGGHEFLMSMQMPLGKEH